MNTSSCLGLLKEIIVDRTINGNVSYVLFILFPFFLLYAHVIVSFLVKELSMCILCEIIVHFTPYEWIFRMTADVFKSYKEL